jgi:hypothetical protein
MNQAHSVSNTITEMENMKSSPKAMSMDVSEISNVVLKRLMEEVKFENQNNILAYDRAHNRHNRGR